MKSEETIKTSTQTILVTGGAGFIGTNFIRYTLSKHPTWRIVNLDAVTYAGNPANLADLAEKIPESYHFVHGDICDGQLVEQLFAKERMGVGPQQHIEIIYKTLKIYVK